MFLTVGDRFQFSSGLDRFCRNWELGTQLSKMANKILLHGELDFFPQFVPTVIDFID